MSNQDHLEALKTKHRDLDKRCQEGFSNYLDDSSLNKMKMEKAHIKSQIQTIEQQIDIKSKN